MRILINLCYDGTNYHGWIKQNNVKTIQGTVEFAIKKVVKDNNFKVYGASKTDAGVHAIAQKVIIEINFKPNVSTFINAINKALPNEIYISDYLMVDKHFDLHNVKQKTYQYSISDNCWSITNSRFTLLWNKQPIDAVRLQDIFNHFVGEKDFVLFSGISSQEAASNSINTIRLIDSITVNKTQNIVIIEIKAKGFIRHQIRYIVQASLMCYVGKLNLKTIDEMLKNKGQKLPHKAKACGLLLTAVDFKD